MSPNRSPQKNQTVIGYCTKIATGFFSLLQGMRLTLSYLVDPRKVVTQQYPENRETLDIFPRFRGRLTMVINETGGNNCTGCGLCEKACPNGTISVLNTKDAAGKKSWANISTVSCNAPCATSVWKPARSGRLPWDRNSNWPPMTATRWSWF